MSFIYNSLTNAASAVYNAYYGTAPAQAAENPQLEDLQQRVDALAQQPLVMQSNAPASADDDNLLRDIDAFLQAHPQEPAVAAAVPSVADLSEAEQLNIALMLSLAANAAPHSAASSVD